ncbi:MAG: hypothetical protein GX496_04565 [Firmicutes bacterium]|nr:hypothetical protein [Bacillota bacterium]
MGLVAAAWESTRFAIWVLVEPQETFERLRQRGSVGAAIVMIGLALAVRVATFFTTAFHFSSAEPSEVNFAGEVLRLLVPLLTWVVANYAVTAILYGEGTLRAIFVASSYCLAPYVLLTPWISLATNVLTLSEAALVNGAQAMVYAWTGLLFFISVKVIHNYEWGQTLAITLLTLATMLATWAVAATVYGLTDQVLHFFREVVREALLR